MRKEKLLQREMLNACKQGAAVHGDEVVEIDGYKGVVPEADGTIVVGIGGPPRHHTAARTVFDHYLAKGKRVVFFDKGYTRADRMRVSVDSFQPIRYLMWQHRPEDRIRATGTRPQPYSIQGDCLLFDGASEKYCQWYGLSDQVRWGLSIIDKIKQYRTWDMPIVYRPRPSHNLVPILPQEYRDIEVSQHPLALDLDRAYIVISHGGNLGFDAVVAGRAHFAIDVSIARPVSEVLWPLVNFPLVPSEEERWQWLCNVAYCQWSLRELASGEAWVTIKEQLAMVPPPVPAPPCRVCGDQGVEPVYGGHNTVLELPCSCEAGIRYAAKWRLRDANRNHDDGLRPVSDRGPSEATHQREPGLQGGDG
jgi:hypothetical protein